MEEKPSILKIIGGVVLTFIFLFLVYKLLNVGSEKTYSEINIIKPNDHVKWSSAKKNILVEYSDFQCPACQNMHVLLNSFESSDSANFNITKNITLVFRHFPLYQIHADAFDSAYAAEAAGQQNKFFEMADLLYGKQSEWAGKQNAKLMFVTYAQKLQLDVEKFKADINSQKVKDKVQQDLSEGEKAGISATPAFFLNGKKLEFQTIEEFIKTLQNTSN